ncbi:YifB family Mg chelatase-like AAA ATPase [Bacillus sp. NTK071]|uniref:YifB family Mg chelatase-like AAA ATPase n=1 Tax=Bacillus sp. NTK071 TaxID=2802175 RepID=UPI001A8FFD87|nr:YifB family Mg chelatase-like AAA ATPase [Bacillus sp. NTK071]MBN8209859.1 YifB family Mg chelatase-like AAA ATPase [Bacillus sp. NTK071]
MSSNVTSIGLRGLEGYRVRVEVQAIDGMDAIVIVGLPDASVKESKERVAAALHSMNHSLTDQKIIINLSPAEQKKNGPLFDLPMALGVLLSLKEIQVKLSEDFAFIGALSLDGGIQPVEGMLPAILAAKRLGLKRLYMPFDEALPQLEFMGLDIIYVSSVNEVIQHLSGQTILSFSPPKIQEEAIIESTVNFSKIIGHSYAKRALEIAAAGEHHLFMSGPPGCGKSMLAEAFPSILPRLTEEARLEVMSLYQLNTSSPASSREPPFRNPHHSASGVSIIGGGQNPKPGEVSLAHKGVLFLDEIAEFTKKTLDMLRQPLESGKVTISRAHSTVNYPAQFILIGAMNPCPCGFLHSLTHYCTCTPKQIIAYQNRLSGPIRDRFDIHLSLKPVDLQAEQENEKENSDFIRKRVTEARQRQYDRYGEQICNGRVSYDRLTKNNIISSSQHQMIRQLSLKHHLSNRAQIKIIRLARTIADLQQVSSIADGHIWEAVKLQKRGEENVHRLRVRKGLN